MPEALPLWGWWVLAVAVLLLVLVTGWLSWTAGRLDRMHLRCEASLASLQTQLVRRASLAAELATGGLTDPASALLLLETAAVSRDRAARDSAGRACAGRDSAGRDSAGRGSAGRDSAGRDAGRDGSWQEHSDLTAVLLAVQLPTVEEEPLMGDLSEACRRVSLARRIHNDQAATTMDLRSRRRVRWFRLAGGAPVPEMIAFDDRGV